MNLKKPLPTQETAVEQPTLHRAATSPSGLPVRTNLRAGLAWDELDDTAQDWWSNLSSSVSGAFNGSGDNA